MTDDSDLSSVLDSLEQKIRKSVGFIYVDTLNKLGLVIEDARQKAVLKSDTLDDSIRLEIDHVKDILLGKSRVKAEENRNNSPAPITNTSDVNYPTSLENKRSRIDSDQPQNLAKDESVPSRYRTNTTTKPNGALNFDPYDDNDSINWPQVDSVNPNAIRSSSPKNSYSDYRNAPIDHDYKYDTNESLSVMENNSNYYPNMMDNQATPKHETNSSQRPNNQFSSYNNNQQANTWNNAPYASSYTSTQRPRHGENNNSGLKPQSEFRPKSGKNAEYFDTSSEILPNGLNLKTYFCKMCEYTATLNQHIHSHLRNRHKIL